MARRGTLISIGIVAALAAGGGAIAGAAGSGDGDRDDTERPITGAALERASRAALAAVPGGRVTETEAGDEDGAYEVEVTRPDGRQVDVHLDEDFAVLDARGDVEDDED